MQVVRQFSDIDTNLFLETSDISRNAVEEQKRECN